MNRTLTARFELDGPLTAANAVEVLLQVPADALLALGERPGSNRPAVIEATWDVPEDDALRRAGDDVPAAGWGEAYVHGVLGPWRSAPCRCSVAPILPDDLATAAGDVMGLADRGVPLPVIPAQTYADRGDPEQIVDGLAHLRKLGADVPAALRDAATLHACGVTPDLVDLLAKMRAQGRAYPSDIALLHDRLAVPFTPSAEDGL